MKNNVFLDTNILVYAHIEGDTPEERTKHNKAVQLIEDLVDSNVLYISVQIINELCNVLYKKGLSHDEILSSIDSILSIFNVFPLSVPLTQNAIILRKKYRFSWWDSLILVSALSRNCSIIYSEDMQDTQIIENALQIINPFKDE